MDATATGIRIWLYERQNSKRPFRDVAFPTWADAPFATYQFTGPQRTAGWVIDAEGKRWFWRDRPYEKKRSARRPDVKRFALWLRPWQRALLLRVIDAALVDVHDGALVDAVLPPAEREWLEHARAIVAGTTAEEGAEDDT